MNRIGRRTIFAMLLIAALVMIWKEMADVNPPGHSREFSCRAANCSGLPNPALSRFDRLCSYGASMCAPRAKGFP